jgi:hypothetical protein
MAPQCPEKNTVTYESKKQLQEQFLAEFLAPPGTRVHMPDSDVFKPADVHSIDELRAAHRADDVEEDTSR